MNTRIDKASRLIRNEKPGDREGVYEVHSAAFETAAEADLVDTLRDRANPAISLVAVDGDRIIGHILFSPVSVSGHEDTRIMGLGPMAVLPGRQRSGVGSQLVESGIRECAGMQMGAVLVLGHPDYYPKFQFHPADRFGLDCEYDVPKEAFMAQELVEGYLDGITGVVRYHPAFNDV